MSTEIAPLTKKVEDVRSLLDKMKPQLALALPRHLTPDRMVRVALTEILRTPKLLDCDRRSLAGAIIQAAQLGLEPGILGLAYLVPFGGQVNLIPGYKGLLMLARRSGQIRSIEARIVHAKDKASVRFGTNGSIEHKPYEGVDDPGPVVAAYSVAHLKDDALQFDWMWRREIDAIRARSRAGQEGPWVTDYEEMAKKTVLRRLCKILPVSIELQTVVALDERAESGLPQDLGLIIDALPERDGLPAATPQRDALDDLAESLEKGRPATQDPEPPRRDTPSTPTSAGHPGVEGAAATPAVESSPVTRRRPGRPRKEGNGHTQATARTGPFQSVGFPTAFQQPEPVLPTAPLPDEPPVDAPENGKDGAMGGHTLEWTLSALGLVETEAQLDDLTALVYGPGGLWVTGDDRTKTAIREAMRAASKRVGA